MEQKDANAIVTSQPTPAGQKITTDTVFDMFSSLVPDSPWARRLKKMQAIFNHLANGAVMLTTIPDWSLGDQVYDVREREALGWDGPNVTQFSKAVTELLAGLQALGIEAMPPAEPLPELDDAIDVQSILHVVGATVRADQPAPDATEEPIATISMTTPQLALFLAEYRRQLIQGE